ncbi:hypothetical protein HPB49_022850 [Dermacentor silvarum]|uniref:Uncharacterized protein n=1 Tax=Dermacentor silvarum TaxID=543639 RepID=A0ACB8DGK6_DERSI|nr:hypothetical protein HPB49_022850 [Dermacentor silvarum]
MEAPYSTAEWKVLDPTVASDMSAVTSEAAASLESLVDVARRELGETPAIKQSTLNDLRQLISGEPSLCCPTDDAFLVKFLRARKYDTQSSFTNVKKYFRVRTDHPELFKDLTPSRILFDVVCRKNRLLTVSHHKDPIGRAVVLLKIETYGGRMPPFPSSFRKADTSGASNSARLVLVTE